MLRDNAKACSSPPMNSAPDSHVLPQTALQSAPPTAPQNPASTPGTPLISVIVRSMGRATLSRALQSIAWQTQRPIEVVVVAAAGPAHPAMPEHFDGLPLILVNRGGETLRRAAAANQGLDCAQGDCLLYLDDDDLLLPDHLSKLAAALAEQPDAVAAFSDVALGRYIHEAWHTQHCFVDTYDPLRLSFENYLPIHAVLFRRRSVQAAGLRFDEQFELFEDWDFWLQLAECGEFAHVEGVSARYIVGEDAGSDVFADTPQSRRARALLYSKWQSRRSAKGHAALLEKLQTLYRADRQRHAEQVQAQRVIAARDEELASVKYTLAARDEELAALRQSAVARDVELANSLQFTEGLTQILAARDREIADFHLAMRSLTELDPATTPTPGAEPSPDKDPR